MARFRTGLCDSQAEAKAARRRGHARRKRGPAWLLALLRWRAEALDLGWLTGRYSISASPSRVKPKEVDPMNTKCVGAIVGAVLLAAPATSVAAPPNEPSANASCAGAL